MSPVRVKICGITSTEDLHTAVKAGADAVGFVVNVPESPRNLSVEKAKEIMKSAPLFVQTVIVTVLRDVNHLEKIHEELNTGTIQVHGSNQMYREIRERLPDTRLIGAIPAETKNALNTATQAAETLDAILLDTHVPGKYGGTGKTHDWNLSKQVRDAIHPKPLILAGGLKPENVKQSITRVKPYAVDVSSGVEVRPGVKDPRKVYRFVKNAKEVEINGIEAIREIETVSNKR
ncbi:MAG: phosphoribosylanthranilate isomerase [Candidatus Jordarchaeum sp.]|uniref:phosphoribosylanthranilate isomerase n=1 Tax=Candidatus Jordarchaeum sp. TaxID=2823881 RepID=UPI00404A8D22